MISKSQIKYIHSLELKKNRKREMLYVAEGPKVVGDLLRRFTPHSIYATAEWIECNGNQAAQEVTEDELRKISFLQHPQQVLAVFPIANEHDGTLFDKDKLYLALDGVQDPGNLGTIIRIADWFGIDTIYCSPDTADAYNPKVVQATMGSIARVNIIYTDLVDFFNHLDDDIPVYGTLLDGEDVYQKSITTNGIIVMGNEGNGISQEIRIKVSQKLLIPCFNTGDTAESLNVAIATAIICSEFRRRQ